MRLRVLTLALVLTVAACTNGGETDGNGRESLDGSGLDAPADPQDDADGPAATETDGGVAASTEDVAEETEAPPAEESDEVDVEITDVVTGLDAPWDVAFLDERAFVTARDTGEVLEMADDGSADVVRSFEVNNASEGGLLGLTAGPEGDTLYAYYTSPQDNRIVRFDPDDTAEPEVIFDGIPAAPTHNGGRIVFGPDGHLYAGTGDAQMAEAAQDPGSLAGKILRLTEDGEVPDDNPTDGSTVYSMGHRNVQGLAFDVDGALYASEFGPEVDDEVNLIEPGGNYGWPVVTGEAGHEDFIDPVFVRQPDEGSWSGLAMLIDGAVPQWEGDLFLASLRGERMWQMAVSNGEVVADREFLVGDYGRLRQVAQAPDGALWMLTNNTDGRGNPSDGDDRIIRLGP